MTLHDLVWTQKVPQKYFRHIAFWLAQVWLWGCWAGTFFEGFSSDFGDNLLNCDGALVLEVIYTYLIVYHYAPKYLETNRYVKFCIYAFMLSVFTYLLFMAYEFWVTGKLYKSKEEQLLMIWYYSMGFIFAGPPAICAMFLTIKMFKNYYLKMVERKVLIKENASAELQFLKAQIHPHFLFNTLNNIYSFSLNKSDETSDLVLKLKNTIRYMVYDCNAESVLLEKEIQLLDNYIGLEKVRYGERLNFVVEITGNYQYKMIAPLLLIPFVENCFKHGISKMRGNHQVILSISVIDNWLEFRISNDKPQEVEMGPSKKGIGLSNVKKRLQLCYPDKHVLEINSTGNKYQVYLKVELQDTIVGPKIKDSPVKTFTYA